MTTTLIPNDTLITDTPEEGRALAVKMPNPRIKWGRLGMEPDFQAYTL